MTPVSVPPPPASSPPPLSKLARNRLLHSFCLHNPLSALVQDGRRDAGALPKPHSRCTGERVEDPEKPV